MRCGRRKDFRVNKTILANPATNGKPDATTERASTRLVLTRTGLAVQVQEVRTHARGRRDAGPLQLEHEDEPMTNDPFSQALEAVMRDADAWMPHKEPDQPATIVGRYVRGGVTADTGYGPSKVITLREEDGHEWTVRLYGKVLAREWEGAGAEIGDVVAIRYKGEEQTRDGTTFRNYRVVVMPDPDAPKDAASVAELSERELIDKADALERRHEDAAGAQGTFDDDDPPF